MKKLISIFLMIVLLMSMNAIAYGQQSDFEGIAPFWINTYDIEIGLTIDSSNKATMSCVVTGYTGTNKITGTALLERKNSDGTYTKVTSWDNLSSSSTTLSFGKDYYVSSGYTYRFTFTATVYKDGTGETVSASKSATSK